jgi:hypothetical protein
VRARGELPGPEEELLGIVRETPEQEAEAARVIAENAEFRRHFLVDLMQRAQFREWLMEVLVSLGTFENAFGATPTGFPDPMATQFQLGRRMAGWGLWTLFDDAAPDLASKMRRRE